MEKVTKNDEKSENSNKIKMNTFRWDNPSQSVFDADGRIQPLNCKRGELANRIITVGDPNRALKIAKNYPNCIVT